MTKTNIYKVALLVASILSIVLYVFTWYLTSNELITQSAFNKIISRRTIHVFAMVIAGILIAFASLSFQTVTNNRLITPSMIGFDAIFIATQTMLVFIFGSTGKFFSNSYYNFIISTVVMLVITLTLYSLVLKKNKNQIFVLLLVGIVISTLVRSITQFLQRIMNPQALDSALSASLVSISNINTSIILLAAPLMIVLIVLFFKERRNYDTMGLGEDNAINLGLNYYFKTNQTMVYIAISMAIATALIGPITFLGLLAVNLAREMFKTYKHQTIMIASACLAIIFLVFGQLIIEELKIKVPVTEFINLVGGSYMIYLIWRGNNND